MPHIPRLPVTVGPPEDPALPARPHGLTSPTTQSCFQPRSGRHSSEFQPSRRFPAVSTYAISTFRVRALWEKRNRGNDAASATSPLPRTKNENIVSFIQALPYLKNKENRIGFESKSGQAKIPHVHHRGSKESANAPTVASVAASPASMTSVPVESHTSTGTPVCEDVVQKESEPPSGRIVPRSSKTAGDPQTIPTENKTPTNKSVRALHSRDPPLGSQMPSD